MNQEMMTNKPKSETQEKKKRQVKKRVSYPVLLLCVLLVGLCLIFTFSYALQAPEDTVQDGGVTSLEIALADQGKGVLIEDMEPMSDLEGKKIESYQFTVQNTGTTKGTYQVLIEDLPLGEIQDGCTKDTLLSRSQLRYQLLLDEKEITTRDLDEVKMNVLDVQEINASQTQKFTLRVWLPESASKTEWNNKHYHYKITVQSIKE